MKISIKTLSNEQFVVEAEPTDTVRALHFVSVAIRIRTASSRHRKWTCFVGKLICTAHAGVKLEREDKSVAWL